MHARRLVLSLAILAVTVTAGSDVSYGLNKVYWTTNSETKKNIPPGEEGLEWNTAANGKIATNIPLNGNLWIAFVNEFRGGKIKSFVCDIEGWWYSTETGVTFNFEVCGQNAKIKKSLIKATRGFKGDSESSGESAILRSADRCLDNDLRARFERIWKPQPKWERIELKANEAMDTNDTLLVKSLHVCKKLERFPEELSMSEGTFGTPGFALGNPFVTEVWLFPVNVGVDVDVTPSFSADPRTGSWAPSFVFVDPDTNARPLGGVRWTTDGPGLAPADSFDLRFTMIDDADIQYDLYVWESDPGHYVDLPVEVVPPVPVISHTGVIVLAILLLAALAFLVTRRQRFDFW